MEILAQFGTPLQQEQWLQPLLNGEIRSCFAMTEPWVASSDATQHLVAASTRDGDDYVIQGHKWFTSGALDPRCKVAVFMGVTDPDADPYHRQSMILVPMDAPGVDRARAACPVFGHSEGGGHGETLWDNVRVPKENLLGEEGSGFAIAQARLGPGRIHHCMRAIGIAERALELMCMRAQMRVAFGKPLADQGVVRERIAESRMQIEQARLLTLKAAWMMDTVGKKQARTEIAAIKVVAARVRHRGDRPRHPAVRRRGRHRRLAARGDVRARAHPAPRRRSRRGAHAPDRAQRARQVRAPPSRRLLMKVRVGYGLGNLRPLDGERLGALAEGLERHGFDSLWLSERISGPAPDPVLGLTYAAAARTKKIKLGTSVSVLPGRSPALVAKEWATLDVLSGGRALPAFGLGIVHPVEQQAFGVARGDRASIFDEALPLLRRLWTEDSVDHDGTWFHYEGMSVLPKPAQPLDVWLGGKAPSELRRVGRLGDGWLASFATPEQCAAARPVIEDAADAAAARSTPSTSASWSSTRTRNCPTRWSRCSRRATPTSIPSDLVARGWPAVREQCERYSPRSASRSWCSSRSPNPRTGTTSSRPGAAEILPLQT